MIPLARVAGRGEAHHQAMLVGHSLAQVGRWFYIHVCGLVTSQPIDRVDREGEGVYSYTNTHTGE